MIKKTFLLITFIISGFLMTSTAEAVCPVCVIGVSTGVGLCRWLKIDDLVSGVWIGGLIVSMIIWLLNWLEKKNIHFKFRNLSISVLFYLLVILPLYFSEIIGHSLNKFLGIDKLLFGIITGSLIFLISIWLHNFLKKKNQGKSYFPFQKVVLPISFLVIISLIFYFVIKCQT